MRGQAASATCRNTIIRGVLNFPIFFFLTFGFPLFAIELMGLYTS